MSRPEPPVLALLTSSQEDLQERADAAADLTVESLSPTLSPIRHLGEGDIPDPAMEAELRRGGEKHGNAPRSNGKLMERANDSLQLQDQLGHHQRKLKHQSSRSKVDAPEPTEGDADRARCKHVDSTLSVRVQDGSKSSKSAPGPQRARSITITSTRHVGTAPSSDAAADVCARSSWDVVLAREPGSREHGAKRLSLVQPGEGEGSQAGAALHQLYRRSSESNPSATAAAAAAAGLPCVSPRWPAPQHREDVFYTEKQGLRTARRSEPTLADHLAPFAHPDKPCPGCLGAGAGAGPGAGRGAGPRAGSAKDAAVQVPAPPPLQLYVLPKHRCSCSSGVNPCVGLLQVVFSQVGLAVVILALALVGAAAFHATEGPHEEEQARGLARHQGDLVVELATALRQVVQEDDVWRRTISRYVERHENLVLHAAEAGYGEGGAGEDGARIWTFPGGLLFAASLLTTLGFGAPVPRTTLGRMTAVLLAVVGIPLNVILALQLGRLLCTRLPRLLPLLLPRQARPGLAAPKVFPSAAAASSAQCAAPGKAPGKQRSCICSPCVPSAASSPSGGGCSGVHWVPLLVPAGSLMLYYLLGMSLFGCVLDLPASDWLLFPLSLTAAGGVARVPGWVRALYAAYLEGGVLLAAVAVALLQAPATTATTDLAIKLGILNMDEYYDA